MIKEYTQTWGVSGLEKKVSDLIIKEVMDYADEVTRDAMGNLIVLKRGLGPCPPVGHGRGPVAHAVGPHGRDRTLRSQDFGQRTFKGQAGRWCIRTVLFYEPGAV